MAGKINAWEWKTGVNFDRNIMHLMFGGQRALSTNIAVILSDAICVELMKMPETRQSGQQASSAKKSGGKNVFLLHLKWMHSRKIVFWGGWRHIGSAVGDVGKEVIGGLAISGTISSVGHIVKMWRGMVRVLWIWKLQISNPFQASQAW